MKRILVVDDEQQITRVLRVALESAGYAVETACDGADAFEKFEAREPDLVITDLAMPKMNGIELTRAIRKRSQVPVIVLSVRDADAMKVQALDDGADDYLTKPFSMLELQARVRVHLRRNVGPAVQPEQVISEGDIKIDVAGHSVLVAGAIVHLTPKEFDLLHILLVNAGKVMTRKALLRAVWGPGSESQPEYLRVLVGQLRKKIDSQQRQYVVSEPWVGYRLDVSGGFSPE